jgi:hypothetical protein
VLNSRLSDCRRPLVRSLPTQLVRA